MLSLVCSWYLVIGCVGVGVLVYILEFILVDVINVGYGEVEGGAIGVVKKEGGVGRKGSVCLVYEDIDGIFYFFFSFKVVGSIY